MNYDSRNLTIRQPLIRILLAFSLLCLSMVIIRISMTGSMRYAWLLWNLFLAWLPLFFVMLWNKNEAVRKSTIRSSLFMVCWLLFFPNAPYILTDLFHLIQYSPVPLWYDLILLLSFAWTGLITGFVSLMEVQHFFQIKFGKILSWGAALFALILGSFGVYLGRYGRFNSWDIIANPFGLARKIFNMITDPFDHTAMYAMTFFLSCFLILSYLTLIVLMNHPNYLLKNSTNELR